MAYVRQKYVVVKQESIMQVRHTVVALILLTMTSQWDGCCNRTSGNDVYHISKIDQAAGVVRQVSMMIVSQEVVVTIQVSIVQVRRYLVIVR